MIELISILKFKYYICFENRQKNIGYKLFLKK